MKAFFNEFKQFAIKGNMIDMAIGIVIGTAFNNVVNTIVKEIITPPLAYFTSTVQFADMRFVIREASETAEEIALGYGALLEALMDFTIIALTIFLLIKGMNRIRSRAEDPENSKEITPKNIELLSKIEKLMEEQNELLKKRSV
jgi:large conductance mechanosensitive channel